MALRLLKDALRKRVLWGVFSMGLSLSALAQTPSTYLFSTNSTSSLGLDVNSNPVDLTTGATQIVTYGTSGDNVASVATNIGFSFNYAGTAYTQFSANSNGLIRLGGTAIGTATYVIGTASQALLAAMGGDLEIKSTNSGVRYKLIGASPNRTLVVEFFNMGLDYTGTYTTPGDGTYQVRLYETSNVIEFVYGSMFRNSSASEASSFNVGISTGTAVTDILSVNTTTGALTNTVTTNVYTQSTNIPNLHSTVDGSRKAYIFTPPPPMVYSSSTVLPVAANVGQGKTNAQVVALKITASGATAPLSLTSLSVNTNGTTSLSDISNLKIYYTGSSNVFATTNQFGSTVATPAASHTVAGTRVLSSGDNYFWLSYDVSATATLNNFIDGEVTSITVGGNVYTPSVTAPAGARQVLGAMSGTYNVGNSQTLSTITRAITELNDRGASGAINFVLTDALYNSASGEAFPITINAYPGMSAVNRLSIYPSGGVSSVLTGKSNSALLVLNGAKYVTIDGRQGGSGAANSFTIQNDSIHALSAAVNFINDASYNKLQYAGFRASSNTATTGVINFGTGTTTGNDSNTISWSDIGDGEGYPSSLIQSLGSTDVVAKYNDYNKVLNCNLFNFWNPTAEANAFKLSNGNNYWTITNNSIYQTSAAGKTTAAGYYTFNLQNSDNFSALNGCIITDNFIGGSAPQCGGTPWLQNSSVGSMLSYLKTGNLINSTFSKNVFRNINITTTSTATTGAGAWNAIQYVNGKLDIDSNIIGSTTDPGAIMLSTGSAGVAMAISSGATTAGTYSMTDNKFGGITLNGGAVSNNLTLINIASATSTVTFNIKGNILGNSVADNIFASYSSSSTAQTIRGINNTSSANLIIRGNIIRNFTNHYIGSGTGAVIGIATSSGIDTIFQNEISDLKAFASATTVSGINLAGGTTMVHRNKIYNLSDSSGTVIGANITAGTTNTFYNNLIGNLETPFANAANNLIGISVTGGTTNNLYYNTVSLTGVSTGTNFGSSAISISATPTTVVLRNNIFSNTSTPNGTGLTVAFRKSSTSLTNYGGTSNNNEYYAGNPGVSNLIFNDGTNSDQTLAAFKTRMGSRDIVSVSESPNFISVSGSTANYLNINTSFGATQLESSGSNITSPVIATDFNGNIRQGNPGYSSQANGGGTKPDIGAWEFDGSPASPIISAIGITPAGYQCTPVSHLVSATIVPNQGVITSAVLNYAYNGVAQTPVAMYNSSGNTWQGTIPAATLDEVVTYTVTAENSLPVSKTEAGKSYKDVPTPSSAVLVNATPQVVCSGSQSVIRATVTLPGAGIVGAGALSTTGSGTLNTTYTSPFDHYYGGTKTQYLIKASELTASGLVAGNILALSLDVVAPGGTYNTFAVNITNTALTALTTTMVSGFTQVYSAASVTPTAGINTYNFASPFVWNGTSNIVVQFCWSNANTGGTATEVKYDQPGFVCESYFRADNSPAVNLCPTATATGTTSNRPRMIFKGNSPMASYSWSDGSTTIGTTNPLTISPTVNTSYTVTVTDTFGCQVTSPVAASVTMSNSTLSGVVQVGAGYTYPTLTSAINAYNSICNLSGSVVFELMDAAYGPNETFPIVIQNNLSASATNRLTIRPATGVNATIVGRNAIALIQLKGADYVTIDGSNNGTNSRNLTISNDTAAATSIVWITSNGLNDGAGNNVIKNTNMNGFSSGTSIVGIGSGSSATLGVGSEFPLRNNRIENNVITKVQNAMYLYGNASFPDSNWVIVGNTLGSSTVTADRLGFRGMLLGFAKNFTISKNRIAGVTTTGTGAGVGIFLTGTIDSGFVTKNNIYDIKNAGAYPAVGIYLASSTANAKVQVDNNMVSDVSGTGSATLDNNGAGIVAVSGGGYNIYFNSVNMVSTQTTGSTTAMYVTSGITGANSINIRNNSFANNSTAAHTRYAIYNAAATTVFTDVNYNNYFTRGTDIGYSGSVRTALTDWRTATGKDVNSISGNPVYARASNLIPDLTSVLLNVGTPIAGITTDAVDTLRTGTPSIGAFQKGMDLTGPSITFTPLNNSTNTFSASITGATITDPSGVNTTSGTKPRVYYKKKGEANVFGTYPMDNNSSFNGWKYQESTSSSSPFDFVLDYSLLNSTAQLNDTIQYFVVAQDLIPLINVGSNPLAGFEATSVNAITAAPTTPHQFIIVDQPLMGIYSVGTAGNFTTLGSAAAAIQLRGLQGDVELDVVSNTTETGAVTFAQWNETGTGNYKLLIKPTVTAVISGNSTGGLVILSGVDRLTFDGRIGGTGNNLTISNTNTAAGSSALSVQGTGCVSDTIRNLILETGSNTVATTGVVIQGDNNNRIGLIANVIRKAQTGISVTSTTAPAGLHQGLYIAENKIGDVLNTMNIGRMGITLANAPVSVITRNIIYNINDITSTLNYGIQVGANSSKSEITANRVDTVFNGNTGGWAAYGINITGSDTLLIANNIITRIALYNYSTTSTTYNPFGLRITSGSGHKVYYNTINLFGNSLTSGTSGTLSAALLVTVGSNLDIRNNILANSYVGMSGSQSYAMYSSVANTGYKTINNNNYYGSGTYGVLGYLGGNITTITAWRTATLQDAFSTAVNPGFTTSDNVTIASAATPNQIESGAEAIAGVNRDFNGDIRPKTTPTTYGGNLAPDMGAYEFDGTPVDLNAPVISYTALATINNVTNRTLSASISDLGTTATGLNTTAGTRPRIYFKKSTDNDAYVGNTSADNGWKWTEATNTSSPFSLTINYSLLFGGSAANLDVIQYFVVAQDNATTPNVGANPNAGFAATSVSAITASPTTPNSYTISLDPPMNGTYQIGSSLSTPNFTSITQAITALSLRGVNGAVTFVLADASYSETFPIEINPYVGASPTNSITIKPASGVNSVISGSSSSSIFKINGADYITIDGSNNGTGSRNLTIENTNTVAATAAIWFASAGSGAKRNTVKNCVIRNGSNTVDNIGIIAAGATISSTATGDYNDSLLIENNDIRLSLTGVYVGSPVANPSTFIRVKNNLMNASTTNALGRYGVIMTGVSNVEISGNDIGNFEDRTSASNKRGIYIRNNSSGVKIFNNNIHDLIYAGTGGYSGQGIAIESATTLPAVSNVDVYNNFISGMLGDGDSYVSFGSTYMPAAVYMQYSLTNVRILNNTINLYGASVNNDADCFSVGIALDDNAQATIYNNIINNKLGLLASTGLGAVGIFAEQNASQLAQSDYNNFIINATGSGLNFTGKIAGVNYTSISDWRTATTKEANSKTVAVTFASNTDLHLTGTSNGNVNLVALPIAGLTLDIDGNTRSALYPYVGADEASNPIPVKLVSLTAVAKGSDVLLSWATASEINNKGFDVERSTDGKTFTKVEFVKGAGNSNRLTSYNLNDANAFATGANTLYYRLKQIDFDGRQAISDVVLVTSNGQLSTAEPVVYPNPFNSTLQVQLFAITGSAVQVNIFDISGREVASKNTMVSEGLNAIEIDKLADLEGGVYFVSISHNGVTTVKKVVKN